MSLQGDHVSCLCRETMPVVSTFSSALLHKYIDAEYTSTLSAGWTWSCRLGINNMKHADVLYVFVYMSVCRVGSGVFGVQR